MSEPVYTTEHITRTEFNQALQHIDSRFEKVEKRLDLIEKRLDSLEQRIEHLEERIDHHMAALMEDNQNKLAAIIEYFDGKFQIFDKRLSAVELALR